MRYGHNLALLPSYLNVEKFRGDWFAVEMDPINGAARCQKLTRPGCG